jgi:hypothetical protein
MGYGWTQMIGTKRKPIGNQGNQSQKRNKQKNIWLPFVFLQVNQPMGMNEM